MLFYYFLAISYLNPYKCVAIFFCPDFTLILAPPLLENSAFNALKFLKVPFST